MIPDELKRMKPMTGSERLGQNRDSEYLGAEDIDPGTEPVLTIAALYNGMITLQRGKENKDVIAFKEETVPGTASQDRLYRYFGERIVEPLPSVTEKTHGWLWRLFHPKAEKE